VTIVPSVLSGSVQHAYSYQSGQVWLGVTSPHSSQGSGWRRGRECLARRAAKTEGGVMADPGLGVRPVLLGSARPQSLGPSLVDASWAARAAS
jgi:hypothetical protein